MKNAIRLAESGLIPDALIRVGIRRLLRHRIGEITPANSEAAHRAKRDFLAAMDREAVALFTEEANDQHYELPPTFFSQILGERRKYSCCYYPTGGETLDQAEEQMLALYGERAELADSRDILELGCGWGSLTLWMAERYPQARITAVSNSHGQRRYIETRCRERRLDNVQVVTCDANEFTAAAESFDRVVSIEMFEHLRNWRQILAHIDGWLRPQGLVFFHVFCHRRYPYLFEVRDGDDWMSQHFFTGGLMPSADLFHHFQRDLVVADHWYLNGIHYARTARHWLENMDRCREQILPILNEHYGANQAAVWFQRWRIFFMSCEELWGLDAGEEWGVTHYLLTKRPDARRRVAASAEAAAQ